MVHQGARRTRKTQTIAKFFSSLRQQRWGFIALTTMSLTMPALSAQTGVHFNHEFAPTDSFVKGPELERRADLCLNGMWEFQPVALPLSFREGIDPAPALPSPDPTHWEKTRIRIPSPWNANSFANQEGQGGDFRNFPSYPASWDKAEMGWLRRTVSVPGKWSGNRVLLHFAAAAGDLQILVNGKPAATKFDIFFPFDVDVTDLIKPGAVNEILIGVRKASLFDQKGKYGRRIYQAGSFWGQHVIGLWQDVDLVSVPGVRVSDVFVEPQVDHNLLLIKATLRNDTDLDAPVTLDGDVRRWNSLAPATGPDDADARWNLAAEPSLAVALTTATVPAHSTVTVEIRRPTEKKLSLWSPESPTLYGMTIHLSQGNRVMDVKYQRFGWRQFQFKGSELLLNGKSLQLRGDSWHFLGIPQMSRRYARAWYAAMRSANLNAVRLHAQPYPEFYLDVADEMGIVVLDETAIWASDGGPKLDSPAFWEDTNSHVAELVMRDRNHPAVMGWSVCNEMKPIVQSVFHNPPGMYDVLLEHYALWRKICEELDPTRPWISADGDDDGNGRLPVYVVHYGGNPAIERAAKTGKPWGVGEAGGAYYATPEQVAKSYGDAAYASFEQRGRGIANDSFKTLAFERKLHADYQSVFNMVWYGLKPLPLGLRDTTRPPQVTDGIFFPDFVEGKPGVQPERLGPYSTTLNPGYDPSLPAFQTLPLYDAIKAAGADAHEDFFDAPPATAPSQLPAEAKISGVILLSATPSSFVAQMRQAGVLPSNEGNANLVVIDGANPPAASARGQIDDVLHKGGTVIVWGVDEKTNATLNQLLPAEITSTSRKSSSLVFGKPSSATNGLTLASLYFSELSPPTFITQGLSGPLVSQSDTLLSMCNTDWTKWNKQPEYAKTAMVLRSERETKPDGAVLIEDHVGNGHLLVTTLPAWSSQYKVQTLIRTILENLGAPLTKEVDLGQPFLTTGILARMLAVGHFAPSDKDVDLASKENFKENDRAGTQRWVTLTAQDGTFDLDKNTSGSDPPSGVEYLSVWLESPRPLDNLLLEPNVPRVSMDLETSDGAELFLNGTSVYNKASAAAIGTTPPLALVQGWNHIVVRLTRAGKTETFAARLVSSDPAFLPQLTSAFQRP
ncbi:glycoside hydrolase family 2 sugar binding protein [Granulicella mallensis MP5ACTX8]|uniref:Glycoside hydrolase family 2 sugar binding protein n=2 Tax=Granulicella mallensis TaxID=940614 RepID=G8NVH2_GRAMM|nr:glycoside hydrolase family 2 sugar binding protein [Granulicella mallensis MP5ACTX8]